MQFLNTKDIMNAHLYPTANQNIRRKDFPYYDQVTIAAGTTEYYFFTTALGNMFQRNKRLPLAGSEVYFVETLNMIAKQVYCSNENLTDYMNELLLQSYLEVSVDNRVVCKLPGMDMFDIYTNQVYTATASATAIFKFKGMRTLPLPIILNSTSAFEFKYVITDAMATALDGFIVKLSLGGLQLDKLDSFYWDNLKANKFQQVPVTYYNTQVIANGNETTFELFQDATLDKTLISQTFPLSDIQTFSCQNIEVFFNMPDTPADVAAAYRSRESNVLRITIDDVEYFNGNLIGMLSNLSGLGATLTTTPDITGWNSFCTRESHTLKVPLQFPANSKVRVTLTQPGSSVPVTGEITVAMRGVETRRVA